MHYTLMVEGINWFECTSADPLEVLLLLGTYQTENCHPV